MLQVSRVFCCIRCATAFPPSSFVLDVSETVRQKERDENELDPFPDPDLMMEANTRVNVIHFTCWC